MKTLLTVTTMLAGLAALAGPAAAAPACPHTTSTNAGTTPPNCNLVITFGPNGGITTTVPVGATPNYDGSDDALIGVVNNSGAAISSFQINGGSQPIFSFDGDGIDVLAGITKVAGNPDTTGYGGADGFFTGISGVTGTVNFVGGIPDGGFDYFSLEAPVNLSDLPTIGVPEPVSMALLGVGLLGLGVARKRRAR